MRSDDKIDFIMKEQYKNLKCKPLDGYCAPKTTILCATYDLEELY